jgi:hypothetical protein
MSSARRAAERVLAAAVREGGARWVLVDFDHTLFGSNSTEQFLAYARPRCVVSVLLAIVRELLPWGYGSPKKWTRTRDYLSVLSVAILLPWNLWRWKQRAPAIFREHENTDLTALLSDALPKRVAIISFGFAFLIRPMIAHSPWRECRLISMPMWIKSTRLFRGKLDMAAGLFSTAEIGSAIFVTDSEDDRDLLTAVGTPVLIRPVGPPLAAEKTMYFPLRYTRIAKFSSDYVFDQFFFVDFLSLVLATQPWPQMQWLGILVALVMQGSLFSVYEIGYFENDMYSTSREKKPSVTPKVAQFRDFPLPRHAWRWALSLGVVGAALGMLAYPPRYDPRLLFVHTLLTWGAMLLGLRAIFWVYNRQRELTRIWTYPLLQGIKSLAPLLVLPARPVGFALLVAQALTMSINYVAYRLAGIRGTFPREAARLGLFVAMVLGLAFAGPAWFRRADIVPALLMGTWCVWRNYRIRIRKAALRPLLGVCGRGLGRVRSAIAARPWSAT